jgi:hypothetical protein
MSNRRILFPTRRNISNRRRLARERLEIYLLHLLLAYRRLTWFGGLLLLIYALISLVLSPLLGFAALVPAVFLLILSYSYNATLYTARVGAWIATLWRHDP